MKQFAQLQIPNQNNDSGSHDDDQEKKEGNNFHDDHFHLQIDKVPFCVKILKKFKGSAD